MNRTLIMSSWKIRMAFVLCGFTMILFGWLTFALSALRVVMPLSTHGVAGTFYIMCKMDSFLDIPQRVAKTHTVSRHNKESYA